MTKKNGSKAKSRRVEQELTLSGAEAASFLEGLARGLRDGSVTVGEASDGIATRFSGDVDIEVQARRSKRKTRIALTIALRGHAQTATDTSEPATLPDEMTF